MTDSIATVAGGFAEIAESLQLSSKTVADLADQTAALAQQSG
jgi:hypothetical protein